MKIEIRLRTNGNVMLETTHYSVDTVLLNKQQISERVCTVTLKGQCTGPSSMIAQFVFLFFAKYRCVSPELATQTAKW